MAATQRPRRVVASLVTEGVSVSEVWPYVLAIFLSGGVLTALGLTVFFNDTLVFAGMLLTSVGIVSMWVPGRGAVRRRKALVIGFFLLGNLMTAVSLTVSTSNVLMLGGMTLSAIGIAGMWLIDKEGVLAQVISLAFVSGAALQATGLTVFRSDLLIGVGMVAVSGGIFGMWVHAHPFQLVRDYERDDLVSRAVDGQQKAVELSGR